MKAWAGDCSPVADLDSDSKFLEVLLRICRHFVIKRFDEKFVDRALIDGVSQQNHVRIAGHGNTDMVLGCRRLISEVLARY
jgi:hypothetical protein